MSCMVYIATATRSDPGEGRALIHIDSPAHGRNDLELLERRINTMRLELLAAVTAAESAPTDESVTIVTLSEYVQKGVTLWLSGWATNGWKNKRGQPLKNVDLWERMLALGDRKIRWMLDTVPPVERIHKEMVEELRCWKGGVAAKPAAMDEASLEVNLASASEPLPERPLPMNYGGW